jgi:rubrerythrin
LARKYNQDDPLKSTGLAKERKLSGNSYMIDYSKKAKFHKVKCPQCKSSLLIKSTVKVCPICEGTFRFLEALKEKQYVVPD